MQLGLLLMFCFFFCFFTTYTLKRNITKIKQIKVCVQTFGLSSEIFPAQLCNMLMQCVALACACNCINFGLLGSGVCASLTAAVVTVTVLV